MSTVLVINSIKRNEWANKAFSSGDGVNSRLENYLGSFPSLKTIELVAPGTAGCFPMAESLECPDNCASLVAAFKEIFTNHSRIIYFWSDTPFLDSALTNELIDHHHKYLSQYSFSDGWPLGLTPEILEKSALEKLDLLSRGVTDPIKRDSLFSLIQKDINAFDLETLIAPVDFRLLRLTLAADSKRNCLLLDRLDRAGLTSGASLAEKLLVNQDLLRTLPAFYQFQISSKRLQLPSYLPKPEFTDKDELLSREDFQTMIEKASRLSGDGVISLSYWGEPSTHPQIVELMEDVLKFEDFRLLIETSGLGWNKEVLRSLIEKEGDRIDWVVELDALDPALYKSLRGEGQVEVLDFINFLGEVCPDKLYVQTTRMAENEDYLEALYQAWKEKPGQLIIKKYDHFCGTLPPRKVTELAPWDRNPCWHIKRDFSVLLDGTVLSCPERLDRENPMGNLLKEEIEPVWERGNELYGNHLKGNYPSYCTKCDEYYTYNF
ncbi:MAG: spiro-SPASM protein [Spirochaetales bacterium]|nr:spiro-SPASM protein [Spirochaetales bacterium]